MREGEDIRNSSGKLTRKKEQRETIIGKPVISGKVHRKCILCRTLCAKNLAIRDQI
jgi:hypothetical protein